MADSLSALFATYPWLAPTAAGAFGAILGSFLNVVILRVPAGRSIVTPGSQCGCGAPIAWYDNIPILSWFILRGKARCCGRAYSIRYAAIEALTAALFAACWLLLPPAQAIAGCVMVGGLICATFIDLDHLIIPDGLTIGGALLGLALSVALPAMHGFSSEFWIADALRAGVASLEGLLIGSAAVLWIAILAEAVLKKDAMGFGDVKLVGAIGAFCGWQGALFSIFGGAVVGSLWVAAAWLWRRGGGRRIVRAQTAEGEETELALGVHVPFGPMLAAGAVLYALLARPWVTAYFDGIASLF
jgi:leader peptidase (prepilin peptidase)/N-methyltransferase